LSKSESTKRTNAIFLLIVLVVGTFTVISPSFMIGAHAVVIPPCEECFESILNDTQLAQLEERLAPGVKLSYGPNEEITVSSLAGLCGGLKSIEEQLGNLPNNPIPPIISKVLTITGGLDLTASELAGIEKCVMKALEVN
jgi:hypothetical protein